MTRYVLQIHCPDQTGLIAGTTQVLAKAGANIVDLTQHSAKDIGIFFLRAVFEIDEDKIEEIKNHLDLLSSKLSLTWQIHDCSKKQRLALFVSKTDHCLYDLLLKQRDGDLDCEFSCIVSNHTVLGPVGGVFGVPFYYVPSNQEKQIQEDRFREIIAETKSDAVILARYMQILSPVFTEEFRYKIINIHHGFLPAFKGAKPYHQAWAKGVKIIGATAHFATEDLDQGPIIAQDVQRIPETASIEQLVQLGK
ncbi:MAG: formyltetrahydrofolate deformylase, partial [Fibrobacteraceae bacterium]|nr:formyltetrahydrofolate deformylase [Fibrobacteraceae bacterium]